ncbi:hypothetical protein J6590_099199 [Homalodisca vitripennis]|nr:hypothetical protein J6590_099199 [Homalodisca vitripennis]
MIRIVNQDETGVGSWTDLWIIYLNPTTGRGGWTIPTDITFGGEQPPPVEIHEGTIYLSHVNLEEGKASSVEALRNSTVSWLTTAFNTKRRPYIPTYPLQ